MYIPTKEEYEDICYIGECVKRFRLMLRAPIDGELEKLEKIMRENKELKKENKRLKHEIWLNNKDK